MALRKLYRSCLFAALSSAALLGTACNSAPPDTMKKPMYEKWNMAKISVEYQLAQQQYEVGDYDKCRKTLAEAMSAGVPHAGLEMLAAKVDIEKGSLETAADHLRASIVIQPADPEPYYLLGVVYQRWQKLDEAAQYYQQAWDRKTTEARYMLAVVEMKITMGDVDEAQQILEEKEGTFEQTAAVRIALARIASLKGDFLTASKHYREAYVLLPDDQNVKLSLAESLFFAEKYADATALLEDMRNTPHSAEGDTETSIAADRVTLDLMLGQCYLDQSRALDARACFQEVTRDNPDNLEAILGLGKACVETNELAAAQAAGKRVLRSDPKNIQAMILIAIVQQKQKNYPDALATLETAGKLAPKDSTVLCMTGVVDLKLGKQDEAEGFFKKAVAINPKDSWATELLQKVSPAVIPPAAPAALDVPAASPATAPAEAVSNAQEKPDPADAP